MTVVEKVVPGIEGTEELIVQCSRCGTCQSSVPLYRKDWQESSVARGKIFPDRSTLWGRWRCSEIFKYLDYCILCGRCKRDCPSGVQTDQIFLKARDPASGEQAAGGGRSWS